ncbi:SH3 domain-containing protein [Streptomyces sp. NPDC002520]
MSVERVEEAAGAEEVTEPVSTAAAVATGGVPGTRYYAVAPDVRLNVRSGPGTDYNIVRVLPYGSKVPIYCQAPGTTVTGPYGTSKIWDNINNGEYVADAYVQTGSDGYIAARCG